MRAVAGDDVGGGRDSFEVKMKVDRDARLPIGIGRWRHQFREETSGGAGIVGLQVAHENRNVVESGHDLVAQVFRDGSKGAFGPAGARKNLVTLGELAAFAI